MKTVIYNILAAGALVLGATSCSESWNPPTSDEGSVVLSDLVIDVSDETREVSSAASRADVNTDDFIVKVIDLKTNAERQSWKKSELPEIVTLPVGTYRVEAESHSVQPAEWEKPYYAGSQEFSIENGKITHVDPIVAKFASVKVTVTFAEDLLAKLGSDVTVTVETNGGAQLDYTASTTDAGYFAWVEGASTMVAHFKGTVDGNYVEYDTPFKDVKAGNWHKLEYTFKNAPDIPEQSGTINPGGIILDSTITVVDVEGNVTVQEDPEENPDRPWGNEDPKDPDNPDNPDKPDNPDNPDDPKAAADFTEKDATNFKLGQENILNDKLGTVNVAITCPKGIQNLVVAITTTSENFRMALEDLNGFDLTQPFDVANPGDLEPALKYGLSLACGDEVKGQNYTEFNITGFMSMLGGFPGKHTFTITVTDSEGETAATDIIIVKE